VRCYGNLEFERPLFADRELSNNVGIQFGLHNIIALIANGVKNGPDWQIMENARDPKVAEFSKKVDVLVHPDIAKKPTLWQVDVIANGKTYTASRERAIMENLNVSYAQVEEKYKHCVSRILTDDKMNRSLDCLKNLEKLDQVQKLMALITP
jgi:hypothetical protein